jgi:hypothetical protein
MANTLLKLGGVAVAIGGAYLYMKNKGKKEQAQALASMEVAQATTQPAVSTTTESATYTKDEAKKLAMSVVDKVIQQLDQIPKDRLADKSLGLIQQEEFKAKQDLYKKVKDLYKSKNQKTFTYLGVTYYTLDGKPVNSGGYNPYEANERNAQTTMSFGTFFTPKTLGDFVNKYKKTEWLQLYDSLVGIFTTMPKSEVDLILPILPKYILFEIGRENFGYFKEMNEKNPLTMQETLLLREANLEKYTPKRDKVLGTVVSTGVGTAIQMPRV